MHTGRIANLFSDSVSHSGTCLLGMLEHPSYSLSNIYICTAANYILCPLGCPLPPTQPPPPCSPGLAVPPVGLRPARWVLLRERGGKPVISDRWSPLARMNLETSCKGVFTPANASHTLIRCEIQVRLPWLDVVGNPIESNGRLRLLWLCPLASNR